MYINELEAYLQNLWNQMMDFPPRPIPYVSDINKLNYRENENFKVSLHGKLRPVPEHSLFKKKFGMTPARYRKLAKEDKDS